MKDLIQYLRFIWDILSPELKKEIIFTLLLVIGYIIFMTIF